MSQPPAGQPSADKPADISYFPGRYPAPLPAERQPSTDVTGYPDTAEYPVVAGYPVTSAYPVTSGCAAPVALPPVYLNVVVQGAPTSGAAVASMVLAIIGLFACCLFGVPSIFAVILGHIAIIDTRSGRKSGRGMAIAGLVLGYLLVAPMILLSFWLFAGGGVDAITKGVTPTSAPSSAGR